MVTNIPASAKRSNPAICGERGTWHWQHLWGISVFRECFRELRGCCRGVLSWKRNTFKVISVSLLFLVFGSLLVQKPSEPLQFPWWIIGTHSNLPLPPFPFSILSTIFLDSQCSQKLRPSSWHCAKIPRPVLPASVSEVNSTSHMSKARRRQLSFLCKYRTIYSLSPQSISIHFLIGQSLSTEVHCW